MLAASLIPTFATFLTNNAIMYTYADPGAEPETKTLGQWFAGGSDAVVAQALNDVALGTAENKTVGQKSLSIRDIQAGLAKAGTEFATIPMANFMALLGSDPFPMDNADLVNAVDVVLTPYTTVKAKWAELQLKPASLAEWLTETAGFAVVADDLIAIRQYANVGV